uniref:Uncharacterized protein n=1 Tax=Glossina brevipalpis TaxID=37001 RepID=A0A1A9WKU0_9MUSC
MSNKESLTVARVQTAPTLCTYVRTYSSSFITIYLFITLITFDHIIRSKIAFARKQNGSKDLNKRSLKYFQHPGMQMMIRRTNVYCSRFTVHPRLELGRAASRQPNLSCHLTIFDHSDPLDFGATHNNALHPSGPAKICGQKYYSRNSNSSKQDP